MIQRTVGLRAITVAVAGVVGFSLLAAACTSSRTSSGTGASTSVAPASTTTVDTTPATTAASTVPPTTVPAAIAFTLRGDGIGPFVFATPASDLISALTTQFGAASSDESADYPLVDSFGNYTSADGETGFFEPFGRTVCWSFQFCAEFGGSEAVTQFFVGWTYGEESGATLASTAGVTIGSRWSDFPAMVVDSGGCYTTGTGSIDGITLFLQSDEVAFGSFDDAGNYIVAVPPADQVSVTFMQAGDIPTFLFADC